MYEVVSYRAKDLQEDMQEVFDQHFEPDKASMVKGGYGKLSCLGTVILATPIIEDLVQTPCCAIIEEMWSLFRDLYRHAVVTLRPQAHTDEKGDQDQLVPGARERLQISDTFLAIFKTHLGYQWDVDDDGSLDLAEPQRVPSASRQRLKRKAGGSGNEEENWHVRHIGQYLPKSLMPRSTVDGYPTQTIASPYGNLPSSTSRDLPSSSLIPPEVSSRGNMGRRQSSNDIIKLSRGHAGLARCIVL